MNSEAYLVFRARLARLARKARLVGRFISASRACRARVACLAHDLRGTYKSGRPFSAGAPVTYSSLVFPRVPNSCRAPCYGFLNRTTARTRPLEVPAV